MRLGLREWDLTKGPKENRDLALVVNARDIFGSWRKALDTANIPKEKQHPNQYARYATGESVLKEIRRRHQAGLSLSSYQISTGISTVKDPTLPLRARKYFGSWSRAVRMALRIITCHEK